MRYGWATTCILVLGLGYILGQCGCETMKSDDQNPIQSLIAKLLPESSADKQKKLRQKLSSPDADVRREGVEMLGEGDPAQWQVTPKILGIMAKGDEDAHVRAKSVQVLAKIEPLATLEDVLVTTANDPSPLVRLETVQALTAANGPQWGAAILLERLAKDDTQAIRQHAAGALQHYRQRKVVGDLVGYLTDDEFAVCYQARQSLQKLTGKDFGYDQSAWQVWLTEVSDPLASDDDSAEMQEKNK